MSIDNHTMDYIYIIPSLHIFLVYSIIPMRIAIQLEIRSSFLRHTSWHHNQGFVATMKVEGENI